MTPGARARSLRYGEQTRSSPFPMIRRSLRHLPTRRRSSRRGGAVAIPDSWSGARGFMLRTHTPARSSSQFPGSVVHAQFPRPPARPFRGPPAPVTPRAPSPAAPPSHEFLVAGSRVTTFPKSLHRLQILSNSILRFRKVHSNQSESLGIPRMIQRRSIITNAFGKEAYPPRPQYARRGDWKEQADPACTSQTMPVLPCSAHNDSTSKSGRKHICHHGHAQMVK
jgi:hypothetical protein